MKYSTCLLTLALFVASPVASQTTDQLAEEVQAAESAFAETMARRDLSAFAGFVAAEAVFVGSHSTLRGAEAIRAGWAPYFEDDMAPFSWEPETVEVLESGALALSSGPVFDAQGGRVGTFNSVWRLEADGQWRVVFDKGCSPCICGQEP